MSRRPSTRWLFTLNNYTAAEEQNVADFQGDQDNVRYLIYGREVGQQGTPHLQGYLILHSQQRLSWLRTRLSARAHYEQAVGTTLQNITYCKKDGDFNEFGDCPLGPGKRTDLEEFVEWGKQFEVEHGRPPTSPDIAKHRPKEYLRYPRAVALFGHRAEPRVLEEGELRDWQQDLADVLDLEPDDRKIIFVVDEEGNKGKSWFCRWYLSKHPDKTQVLGIGKKDDIAHMIDERKSVFLFNLARGQMEYLNFSLLENLKDRMVISPKYNSRTKILGSNCHVVIFGNELPDWEGKLTPDRIALNQI